MRPLRIVELAFGWLAVILGAALLAFINTGGFIAPDSVAQDVIGFSIILVVLAIRRHAGLLLLVARHESSCSQLAHLP